jgi:hypothetical protein
MFGEVGVGTISEGIRSRGPRLLGFSSGRWGTPKPWVRFMNVLNSLWSGSDAINGDFYLTNQIYSISATLPFLLQGKWIWSICFFSEDPTVSMPFLFSLRLFCSSIIMRISPDSAHYSINLFNWFNSEPVSRFYIEVIFA